MSTTWTTAADYVISSSESDEGVDTSFNSLHPMTEKTKVFNDMVHGSHVKLPSLCNRLINTPQFQRLRNLKQLGLCYFVYPSASHNRFEHCIGTSFLSGEYCKILRKNQPELNISDVDVLCLYIAGLCHDLGHGPFSHAWEHFMKRYNKHYSHEEMSIRMLDYMIDANGLWEWFKQDNLEDIDRVFIKELILGEPLPENDSFKGRGPEKNFLYQIVSNKETEIDVDKFDYLLRDGKQLNVTTAFDYQRIFDNSRVFPMRDKDNDELIRKIVYRKKISGTLEDLFKDRFRMHQIAYQHRVTKVIEEMVVEGLVAAEPDFKVHALDGKVYRLSTAYEDLSAFMKLTDSVFDLILQWSEDCSPAAKMIFRKILRRDLYRPLGNMANRPTGKALEEFQRISDRLLLIQIRIDFGKGTENPLNGAFFYEKSCPGRFFSIEFAPPKKESKCFVVYKPLEGNSDASTTDSLFSPNLDFLEVRKQLKEWAVQHDITIYFE